MGYRHLRIVSGVRKEAQREASRIKLDYLATALNERRCVARVDVMDEPKLLVQAARKCRGWADPTSGLHHGSIQLEHERGYCVRNVGIGVTQ